MLTVTAATLTSIAVTPANPSIVAGTNQQFVATGTYSNATTALITGSVTWASATTSVATISAGGLAHGVAAGTSSISATLGLVSGSTILTVTAAAKPVPVLTYTGPTSAVPAAGITLTATLKTTTGTAVSGKTVTFTLNGATLTATTNKTGIASVKTKAPAAGGTYPIGVAFAGDATYAAASTSANLAVQVATKLTYTGPTKAARGASITLSATLKTASGTVIAGQTVAITLNGITQSVVTNASGVASWLTTAPTTAGKYTVTVTFAGTSTNLASSTSASLTIR